MTRKIEAETKKAVEILVARFPSLSEKLALTLYISARRGGEISEFEQIDEWIETRVRPSFVTLNDQDYISALIQALKLTPNLAGSDMGGSRQRDAAQVWTDTARGFLGELAFQKLLMQRFGAHLHLDYTKGAIEEFLPSDIKSIHMPNGETIEPKKTVSLKTTKFSGLWLDIPGAQINHSDIFALVKIGVTRFHFLGFLKWISFMRDKLFPLALKSGALDEGQAEELWDSLPEFGEIPCYIPGFVFQQDFLNPYRKVSYGVIHHRNGTISYVALGYIGRVYGKPVDIPEELSQNAWQFSSIGQFSDEQHYVANTGYLRYSNDEWSTMFQLLVNGE